MGGVAPRPPCSPSGGRPAVPYPACPLVVGAFPPGVRVRSGSRGRPVHRVRPAWRGGGGGAAREPLPRGPHQTKALPSPPPGVGYIAGVTGDPLVMGGAAPILLWIVAACRPSDVVRASLRRAGAGSPVSRDLRGRWRRGALGRAACGSSCVHPPRVAVPSGGGGASPASGGAEGRRLCGPQAGGGARGGGGGAAPRLPAPLPCPVSASHPLSPARPPGVYSCCGGCRAAVGVGGGPVARQWVSAAGGGGGGRQGVISSPWFAPQPSPGLPLSGPLRLRRPGRRRSVVGR